MRRNRIYFVSGNLSKQREIEYILSEECPALKILGKKIDLAEPKGLLLEDISREKALSAYKLLHAPVLVDDTGIIFGEYGCFPGPYSKDFFMMVGYKGILKMLAGKRRDAYYKSVISYTDDGRVHQFTGEYHGTIRMRPVSTRDPFFPYDALFMPLHNRKARSKMSEAEGTRHSHRRIALQRFAAFIRRKLRI